jgi:hypothetical protein
MLPSSSKESLSTEDGHPSLNSSNTKFLICCKALLSVISLSTSTVEVLVCGVLILGWGVQVGEGLRETQFLLTM